MSVRFFVDEDSLAVGKALAAVRPDVTYPGHSTCPIQRGELDEDWLPKIGALQWVALTRNKAIRYETVERRALIQNGVRAVFLTAGGNLSRFEQLRVWIHGWDAIEGQAETPGPWIASLTRGGFRLLPLD